MRAFGVGCMSFEYVRTDEKSLIELEELLRKDFESDLTVSLKAIPGLKNLHIFESPIISPYSFNFESSKSLRLDSFRDENFFIRISRGIIRFSLYIPLEVQFSLPHRWNQSCENFIVTFNFNQDLPLVFVESVDPEVASPSGSIVVVREYLKSQFLHLGSEISLKVLGPTPFHCDFWLRNLMDVDQNEISVKSSEEFFVIEKQLRQRGYDDIHYLWAPTVNIHSEKITRVFIEDLAEQLSLFYRIVSSRNTRAKLDLRVIRSLENIYRTSLKKGIWAWFKRVIRNGHRIRRLILEILNLKLITEKHERDFRNDITELKDSEVSASIQEKIIQELSMDFVGQFEETKDLALAFQNSRTQEMTNFLVVFSVLVATLASILFH